MRFPLNFLWPELPKVAGNKKIKKIERKNRQHLTPLHQMSINYHLVEKAPFHPNNEHGENG
jgi:hypothetical protein